MLKSWATIASYAIGTIAVFVTAFTYWSNSRRERAKWAAHLYEKFYEDGRYKDIREKLDSSPNHPAVVELVTKERSAFTDYLNFFELVAFLARAKQITGSDVLSLFQYYLDCLRRHRAVMEYIGTQTKGFEQLKDFLNETAF